MRTRQAVHICEQRLVDARCHRQILPDHPLVDAARDRRIRQQRLRLGREEEQIAALMVVKRFETENVACAQQLPTLRVPEAEGEVAEQSRRAVVAPEPVRGHDVRRIEWRRER